MTVMISSTTQSFFAWRIIKLTGQKWLGCSLWVLAFTQLVAGAIGTVGGFVVKDFARFRELKVPVTVWLGTGTVTDVLITGVLIWYLHTHRTGYSKTDDVITKLIRLTMQTGLIVTIWAAINLFLYLFLPEGNNVYLFFQLPLCKLYTNTLMSTLNARVSLREELTSNSNIRSNPNEPWTSSPGPSNFRVPTVNQASTKLTVPPNSELEEYGMGDTKWAAAKDIETLGSPHLGTAVRLSGGA
ncbi:hypothetical protein CTheo_3729 [Ceratobasidium theobromae]|uniref:DUF6534 domain-containing protein n=1 Tax=Ceratobasidium theobromae TaxID=1582974 RepID=A0A5N5QMB0_9AGAM|nr:hypothetical protein CTheo_3729 [Ceratobasidium theobromae]